MKHFLLFFLFVLISFTCISQTTDQLLDRAFRFLGEENYKSVITTCNTIIEMDSTYSDAYELKGRAMVKQGDRNGALKVFDRMIASGPSIIIGYLLRAELKYNELNDFVGAMADFGKAVEIEPANTDALIRRGKIERDHKDFKEAIADYTKAIEQQPKFWEFYYSRGVVKMENKDFNGAMGDFDMALYLNPKNGKVYCARGIAKVESGYREGGCNDFKEAKKLNYSEGSKLFSIYCMVE